jgi:hypothetical protein
VCPRRCLLNLLIKYEGADDSIRDSWEGRMASRCSPCLLNIYVLFVDQEQIVEKTLLDYGFTKGRIIILLLYAVSVLILIFVFIFVGVAAFTGAGTLG